MNLTKELNTMPVEDLAARCTELYSQGISVPPSVIRRLSEFERVLRMLEFDKGFGKLPLAGIDEAGRGPLAGSVYAAAVILPEGFYMEGINDSKRLSEKKRESLYEIIMEKAEAFAVEAVDCRTIDEVNIRNATFIAMNRAAGRLGVLPEHVLVDGNAVEGMTLPHTCVIGGDSKSQCIAAASVLAKVSRDRYMSALDAQYPQYGFAKHKGYGSKEHIEAIIKYGPCPEHRRTFLKNFYKS